MKTDSISNIDIIKYDSSVPRDSLQDFVTSYRLKFPDKNCIFIPNSWDIVLNASKEQLKSLRKSLESIIDMIDSKLESSQEVEDDEWLL